MSQKEAKLLPYLPQRLRELRLELGWTLEDVAVRVGVTQAGVVSNWEATNQRRRTPELSTLLLLQRWYGVSMDYLLGNPLAERDSPSVRKGKLALREALRRQPGLEAKSARERAEVAWSVAQKVAPDAFFTERLAACLLMSPAELAEVTENAFWSNRLIERLAPFLGLSADWFYATAPVQVPETIE